MGFYALVLIWEPKVPPLSSSKTIPSGSQKSQNLRQNVLGKHDTELIDGLFVPQNDPRKGKCEDDVTLKITAEYARVVPYLI
ncbi:hypothetical protein FRX31_013905 [Thalictrum thalictroides]|uniref:Uncharacterized protein n=1 Tax=Thalictrum thalictroides TaxID=46969 RepID=A0A7J6WHY1_THATH|nr:hypothetical protein FRX31_013905 [Thalictrum thalictroides]